MNIYENSEYITPKESKMLILDINADSDDTKQPHNADFYITLQEQLVLSEEYEIYLESITTFKTKVNTGLSDICFLLKFHDFNIQNGFNYKNNANTLTKLEQKNILIPNSCITDDATAVSKGKKLNFICSLLPIKISEIHLSLTNLDNATIFTANDGRAIIELLCIPKNKKLSEKEKLDLALYEHTNYFDDRNKHLIIDLESTTDDPNALHFKDFSVDLVEPLIIDRQSDIYLDSIIYNNSNSKNDINNMGLLLDIDEFDIDNGYNLSTNNKLESHKMLIPNENILNDNSIIENLNDITTFGGSPIFTPESPLFENGSSNIGGGLLISASGPGNGWNPGGFSSLKLPEPRNNYIRFFGISDTEPFSYIPRSITTKNIRTVLETIDVFSFYYIAGNNDNGGETPDQNENLEVRILDADNNVVTTITIQEGSMSEINLTGASEWTLYTAPQSVLTDLQNLGHKIQFRQSLHTAGSTTLGYDTYGIKYIKLEGSGITISKSLKSTRYNYISTINPKIISKINGSISNLNNASIVDSDKANCRVVMDFLIKPCL